MALPQHRQDVARQAQLLAQGRQQGLIRRLLTRYAASGSTVLFSSHVMELVEQVCDHVSIIDQGTIVATGTTEQVRGGKTLQQAFIDLVGPRAHDEEGLSWLGSSSS